MRKVFYTLSASLLLLFLGGCTAANNSQCGTPDFCKEPVKVKKVNVSECPRKVKTVIYESICSNCNNFPVTVRENNCCYTGGCK